MSTADRRFTDREVALVLKKATELDEPPAVAEGHGGTSLEDLRSIALEVGISSTAVDRAVASLDARMPASEGFFGPRGVRKAVQALPSELDRDAVGRLVRVVDQNAPHAGTVTEALGSVRWMGRDRLKSTQVSITSTGGETAIEVVEKAEAIHRYAFQLLPAAWGAMLAMPAIVGLGLPGIALAVAAAGGGFAVGRLFWNRLQRLGQLRVKRLADALADEGQKLIP